MVKAVRFKPDHLMQIELNEVFEDKATILENYSDVRGYFIETIMHDSGQILAILSGVEIFRKNMEVSALVSPYARRYPVQFFRCVKDRIKWHEGVLQLRRVQTTIKTGHHFLVKWIELLGFEPEGYMHQFGPEGDDYMLYAKVRKWARKE